MHLRLTPALPPAALWVALAVCSIASLIAAFEAGAGCVRELRLQAAVADRSHIAQLSAQPSPGVRPNSYDGHGWPTVSARTFDELARFSARVAHEQRIDLVQLQSEPVNTAPVRPRKMRIRLQVRGDYVGTKAFVASLLTDFPGLTLDHLTIRHNLSVIPGGEPAAAARGGDDESAIELIQYSMPVQAGA